MPLPVRAALAAALTFVAFAAVARAATPTALNFTVLRNGEVIGSHTLKFRNDAKRLQVTVDTAVVVKVAIIPVYRFEYHDTEVWQNGHLTALSSKTNDDGTHHHLNVVAEPDSLDVKGDDKESHLPPSALPASLWNPATVRQAMLMNTLDGHAMTIKVADLGEDTVSVHGKPRRAHHYAMTGDLSRELWYDADGTLVQVRFKAKDNSDLRYVLR